MFMNILTTNGYVARFVTDWAGPEARLRNIKIRLGAPAIPGQPLRFSGRVEKVSEDRDERVIEVSVRAANDLGDHATGTVELGLPLAEGMPMTELRFDPDALRAKYREERDKRLRTDGIGAVRRAHREVRALRARSVRRAGVRARSALRRGRRRADRRRLRRTARGRAAARAGRRERPPDREGRRCRRHLVLEPLPRARVRHRVVRLPAAARRARLHAGREVQPRPGDLRALPGDREAVRPVPRRVLPDLGHRDPLGRRRVALDRVHRSRRRDPRALRRALERVPAQAEAAGRARNRDVPRPRVPHLPLGLRLHRRRRERQPDQPARQARRHHRHGRHRGAVHPAPRRVGGASLRVPAHAVVDRRARQSPDRSRVGESASSPAGSRSASRTSRSSPAAGLRAKTW